MCCSCCSCCFIDGVVLVLALALLVSQAESETNNEDADHMSVVFTGTSIVEEAALAIGMWIDVYCLKKNTWLPAKVVKMDQKRVRVHFHKWSTKWDEWVFKVGLDAFLQLVVLEEETSRRG